MDIPPKIPSKVPGYNLYIDGFQALRRSEVLRECNITHIVSVVDWKFQGFGPIQGFQHLHIPVDDVYDTNLLEWFPRSNAFIHEGLNYWNTNQAEASHTRNDASTGDDGAAPKSGVLIHCAMGVSRSATILSAYLLWITRQNLKMQPTSQGDSLSSSSTTPESEMIALPPTPLSLAGALALIRQSRPHIEPNSGFIKQLGMYVDMNCPTTQGELEGHKIYRRWMNKRAIMEALSRNEAPDVQEMELIDEEEESDRSLAASDEVGDRLQNLSLLSPTLPSQPSPSLRCRKCRHLLASPSHLVPHSPSKSDPSAQPCAHFFTHPLSWMRPALATGALDGRLSCPNPKCAANVGKFAWQGLRCSCGGWMTPGFGLVRAKVDEIVERAVTAPNGKPLERGAAAEPRMPPGVRLPPGMRREGGNL